MSIKTRSPALQALSQPDFARYAFGRLAGTLAWQMINVVAGFQVWKITRDPLDLGLIGLAQFLPFLALVLPGGQVADRFDRRIIIACAYTAELTGAAILLWGNGLQGILLPVRATIEHFSTSTIGVIASAYSLGFVISCRYTPHIVKRVGHIRSFAVLAAIASCVVLLLVLLLHPAVWIPLRLASGFCFAGLFMVIESWLNERADNTNRGQIFSTYMVINLTAVTLGQLVLPPLAAMVRALAAPGGGNRPWARWVAAVFAGYRTLLVPAKVWEIRQRAAIAPPLAGDPVRRAEA